MRRSGGAGECDRMRLVMPTYEEAKQQVIKILDELKDQPKILDIGCGTKKRGNIGLDLYPFEGVDIVWDIQKGLPFPDDSLDGIYIYHVLEHLSHGAFDLSI